ncbi:MAG: hypothetical protein LKJ31_07315 [Atopobiaceae bacterium]|nr:hypothetical protein [Atopobiaceae bacterium]
MTFAPVDTQDELIEVDVVATLNHAAIEKTRRCADYNMIVTSETDMDA